MVSVYVTHGKAFVWNAEDAFTLKTKYHIVGNFVGCLPRQPYQISENGLPLQLLPEEVTLLLEKGYISLVSNSNFGKVPSSEDVEHVMKIREYLFQQQVELFKEERKKTIMSMADVIVEGKRKKTLEKLSGKSPKKKSKKTKSSDSSLATVEEGTDEGEKTSDNKTEPESEESITVPAVDTPLLDRDAILEEELKRIPTVPKETCMVQLFTEDPLKRKEDDHPADWRFPLTDEDVLRYAVFKDLWEKGHYLTSGTKFGGDFLVYAGDPLKFHALYVVVCVPYSKHFKVIDLVLLGRLGTQVKKSVVLATVTPQNKVDYITLRWMGE